MTLLSPRRRRGIGRRNGGGRVRHLSGRPAALLCGFGRGVGQECGLLLKLDNAQLAVFHGCAHLLLVLGAQLAHFVDDLSAALLVGDDRIHQLLHTLDTNGWPIARLECLFLDLGALFAEGLQLLLMPSFMASRVSRALVADRCMPVKDALESAVKTVSLVPKKATDWE